MFWGRFGRLAGGGHARGFFLSRCDDVARAVDARVDAVERGRDEAAHRELVDDVQRLGHLHVVRAGGYVRRLECSGACGVCTRGS